MVCVLIGSSCLRRPFWKSRRDACGTYRGRLACNIRHSTMRSGVNRFCSCSGFLNLLDYASILWRGFIRSLSVKNLSEAEQEQLLADCVAEKDAGWEALFRHFHPIAFWVASGPTFRLSKEQSEDVAQVTMVGLCTAIRKGTVRSLSGCVRAIAHNKCIDLLRKNDPLRHTVDSPGGENDLEWIPDLREVPLETAESDAFLVLRQTLETMGNPCLGLLMRRYYKGASYKETAAATSIPFAQVGVRIKRCLEKLKKMLEQERPAFSKELEALMAGGVCDEGR